jgi:hypothetical protein
MKTKTIVSGIVVALTITALPALARTSNANVTIPSAQNSGVGIPGFAGSEAGPIVQPGTVGSGATVRQYNLSIREQDAADIPGLRGTEAGPSVNAPSHLS